MSCLTELMSVGKKKTPRKNVQLVNRPSENTALGTDGILLITNMMMMMMMIC